MGYSACDYIDSILDALSIKLSEEETDDVSAQADKTLNAITRLQRIEQETGHALAVFDDTKDAQRLIARLRVILKQ